MNEPGLSSAVDVRKGITLSPLKGCQLVFRLLCVAVLAFSAVSFQTASAQEDWKTPDWVLDPAKAKTYYRSEYYKAKTHFRSATLTAEQTKQIRQVVAYYLSQLTHDDIVDIPKNVGDRFLNELAPTLTSPAVRQLIMEEVLARAPELLTHPREIVRYNLLGIILQLNVKPASNIGSTEVPAAPFTPAWKVLIPVIKDKNQFMSCRILAARGISRICRDGDGAPSSPERSDIATALVDTLHATPPAEDVATWWFRGRLIDAIGSVDRIDNTSSQPIVIEALLDVITNPKEVIQNRALAAQAITQLPYTSSTNVTLITDEIMKLLSEMCSLYAQTPTAPAWNDSFVRIYLAFRPATARQAKDKKWGLLYQVERPGLNSHASYVKGAWDIAFPILKPFVEATPIAPNAKDLKQLADWLKNMDASNRKIVPNGKDYAPKSTATLSGPAKG